jgi:thymidylate synthase (FAD)
LKHLAAQSTVNRQGRGKEGQEAEDGMNILRSDAERNYDRYIWMLNEGGDGKPMMTIDPGLLVNWLE